MKEIIKALRNICASIAKLVINSIIFLISLLIFKDKKMIIVGPWFGDRWADNSRYFMQDAQKQTKYKVYLIVKNKKLYNELNKSINCVYRYSLKSIYLHFRAKFHVVDQGDKSLIGFLSVRAIRINLWHGLPMKKLWDLAYRPPKNKFAAKLMQFNRKLNVFFNGFCSKGGWDNYYLLTPSLYDWENFLKICVNEKLVKPLFAKYPRTDYLKNYIDRNNIILSEEKKYLDLVKTKAKEKKLVLYVPTFRDKSSTLILGTNNDNDINKYIELLNKNNCVLVIKMHSADMTILSKYDNCIILNNYCDISTFLPYMDCLITDYSSVFFDYLIFNRPIIFYPYDYDYYDNSDRGILPNYTVHTPGEMVYNFEELYTKTKVLIKNNFKDKKETMRKELLQKTIDSSFPSVLEAIDNLNKKY